MYEKIKSSAEYIKHFLEGDDYQTGIILGSGLGELGNAMEKKHVIPYAEIPHFPISTVQGHAGNLILGRFGGKNVIAMQGRFHYYEGYSMQEVTFPVRVLHELGVHNLFVSNAAVMPGKRGPSSSIFFPRRGCSGKRLIWSVITIKSPTR